MPELLQRLNWTGGTVSVDAMGTPTEIARTIIDGGGDYTLALQGNQPTMHEPVKDCFETAPTNDFKAVTVEKAPQIEGDHGRIETRTYLLTALPEYFANTARWSGLTGLGGVIRTREIGENITRETASSLWSYCDDIKRFSPSARGHWGIEKSRHGSLDVSFNEDQSRLHKGFAGENLAVIRHLALNLLKPETNLKGGLAAKRKCAG